MRQFLSCKALGALLFSFLFILLVAPGGHADTIKLVATPTPATSVKMSEFTVEWDDNVIVDNKFQLAELVKFSGVTHNPIGLYRGIKVVPAYDPYLGGAGSNWVFEDPMQSDLTGGVQHFTYSLAAVPLPGALLLLGAGLLRLAAYRRRQQG